MSRTEYDRLLDLAGRKPAGPEHAPGRGADPRRHPRPRRGAVGPRDDAVDGEVFRRGVAKVPLIKGATLLEARMDNRPLPVIAEGGARRARDGSGDVLARRSKSGRALSFTPGRGAFILPVPSPASVTATIDVPGDQTDVHLSTGASCSAIVRRTAGRRSRRRSSRARRPRCGGRRRQRADAATARDVRLLSDVKSIVTIGDADVRLVSLVDVTIVQGEPSQIVVTIPAGYEVVSVSGASLERTEIRAGRVVALRLGSGAPAAPVPRQPRAPARRRIVQARDRVPDASRRAARNRRSGGRGPRHARGRRLADAGPPPHGRARGRSVARRRGAAGAARRVPLSAHRRRAAGAALDVRRFADAASSRPSPSAPSRRRSSRPKGAR